MDCSNVIYCGDFDGLSETVSSLVTSICDKGLIRQCGDVVYIVQNSTLNCLTDCQESGEPEQKPWVRPVTCAAIAVSALVFFTILYFGKSWTESRGTDRRQLRKQGHVPSVNPTPTSTQDRISWGRLKVSVLAGSRVQVDNAPPETPKSNQPRRDTELELAMFDAKS